MTFKELFANKEHFWNVVFLSLYLFYALILFLIVYSDGEFENKISTFDFILISLATFRLIRLFSYDKITFFIRDYLGSFSSGPGKTLNDLLNCPWCFGIWASTSLVFSYYAMPFSWFFILILAISGLGSFMQILINMIGWRAEIDKTKAAKK